MLRQQCAVLAVKDGSHCHPNGAWTAHGIEDTSQIICSTLHIWTVLYALIFPLNQSHG